MPVEILNTATELVPVKDLQHHPRNANRGDVPALVESFRANGFYGSVVAQKSTGYVLIGNHRLTAARKCRMKTIPVTWVDVDDERALRLLTVDNRTNRRGEDDPAALADLLEELANTESGLEGTGFRDDDLLRLLEDLGRGSEDLEDEGEDHAPGPDAPEAPPPGSRSDVRQFNLYLDSERSERFLEMVDWAKIKHGADNLTDAVYLAMRQAFEDDQDGALSA